MEKEMATHSSILAWRIPGIGEPGGLPSMGLGCTESDTTEATQQQQQQHVHSYLLRNDVTFVVQKNMETLGLLT